MTTIFLHLPKTGGTSVNKLISTSVKENQFKSLSIHNNNIFDLQSKSTSYFESFKYIHIHACVIKEKNGISDLIRKNPNDCFTIFRFPSDYFESFWRHSTQISPQALPSNSSIPSLHERFDDINLCIEALSTSKLKTVDFNNQLIKEYWGLKRMFIGQLEQLRLLMGLNQHPTAADLNWFVLEDPNLDNKLRNYLGSKLGFNLETRLSKSNTTRNSFNSKLTFESIQRLGSIYKKDTLKYLELSKEI